MIRAGRKPELIYTAQICTSYPYNTCCQEQNGHQYLPGLAGKCNAETGGNAHGLCSPMESQSHRSGIVKAPSAVFEGLSRDGPSVAQSQITDNKHRRFFSTRTLLLLERIFLNLLPQQQQIRKSRNNILMDNPTDQL